MAANGELMLPKEDLEDLAHIRLHNIRTGLYAVSAALFAFAGEKLARRTKSQIPRIVGWGVAGYLAGEAYDESVIGSALGIVLGAESDSTPEDLVRAMGIKISDEPIHLPNTTAAPGLPMSRAPR